MGGLGDWARALETWLEPFLARLGHPARRRMCPLYVAGLIGPGERKSLQPIAARLAPADYDQLHHFIAVGPWEDRPLEAERLTQADRLVGGPDTILVIDDTALPRKGQLSVGVAPQYASALGKNANCQTLVSLTLAQGEVPVPIALRLFLPEAWTKDPERMRRAGVPDAFQSECSKPEIALAELKRALEAGVRFGAVVADAGYGISAAFRQALSALGLLWAVGVPRIQKVYPVDVQLVPAPPTRGRPRKTLIPGGFEICIDGLSSWLMRIAREIGRGTSVQALRERRACQERRMRTKQRYRCKACGLNFTDTPPRGKPLALKVAAVLLYVSGLSMNRTAKLLGVLTPTIQAWLEQFAAAYAQKPEPEGRAVVIELDEMWHYLEKVRTALDLESLGSCDRSAGGLGMRRS